MLVLASALVSFFSIFMMFLLLDSVSYAIYDLINKEGNFQHVSKLTFPVILSLIISSMSLIIFIATIIMRLVNNKKPKTYSLINTVSITVNYALCAINTIIYIWLLTAAVPQTKKVGATDIAIPIIINTLLLLAYFYLHIMSNKYIYVSKLPTSCAKPNKSIIGFTNYLVTSISVLVGASALLATTGFNSIISDASIPFISQIIGAIRIKNVEIYSIFGLVVGCLLLVNGLVFLTFSAIDRINTKHILCTHIITIILTAIFAAIALVDSSYILKSTTAFVPFIVCTLLLLGLIVFNNVYKVKPKTSIENKNNSENVATKIIN